jgi:hypothetical protein
MRDTYAKGEADEEISLETCLPPKMVKTNYNWMIIAGIIRNRNNPLNLKIDRFNYF